ncbi:MAG: hypothetical protein S4CHLAM81_04510 [Chlamydiales bacterium]|nr:hypothetical protein [Chlamydiales bacterium]MCH9635240.1 hypothetical protein [Chlamydiales bacterium]MCH9704032.1 hypothetical protein [Chlamydiota bacterium]
MINRFILTMILLSLSSLAWAFDVDTALQQISYRDRVCLQHFFHKQIKHDHLGYPLFFSDKPAAQIVVRVKRSNSYYPSTVAGKGWQVWKKYEHLFPHSNFIFCEDKQINPKYFHLVVINKESLRKVVVENEGLFKEVLDKLYLKLFEQPFSPDLFINKLEEFKRLQPLILFDEALYGLILGYGRESSVNCKRYRKEGYPEDGRWAGIPGDRKKMIIHGKGGKTYVKTFGIRPVRFGGDPESKEVQALAKTYEEQCIQLRRMFRRKGCLKPVLEALCATDKNTEPNP